MKILISFVGTNDAGTPGKKDGAILTIFRERKFEEVHLLYNPTLSNDTNFYKIAKHVEKEILKKKFVKKVYLHSFECNNVVDHNEIYPKLLDQLIKISEKYKKQPEYFAGISSGTPAMQVCWILIAESDDFPLKLIRSNEPKYGKPYVSDVKLSTALPKIVRLQEEIEELKKVNKNLLPEVILDVPNGNILIGNDIIPFSPVEFSYYRYFLNRNLENKDFLKLTSVTVPEEFLNKIIQYHKDSYPDAESSREELIKIKKKGFGYSTATFRSNVSKINKKVSKLLNEESASNYFKILGEGVKYNKKYGISLSAEKIRQI